MGSFTKAKTIIQATILVSAFSCFFSCAKEEDVPLSFEEGKRTGIYAIDAITPTCTDYYFVTPTAGTPIATSATAWYVPIDMGRLNWGDDSTDLEIVSMRFEVRDSSCIENFTFPVTDAAMSCMTLDKTVNVGNDSYATQYTPNPPTQPWTFAQQPIYRNSSVKFYKLLVVYGMTPRVPKGVNPETFVPNCTASGLIKITAVKYSDSTSDGKNVRKSFPFSFVFQ